MNTLKRPYTITVWKDNFSSAGVTEEQIATIGSDNAISPCYAKEVKFKRNVNGTNELTFKLYRKYIDTATGDKVDNPLVELVNNETKLKLHFQGRWYDLLVKNIAQDSSNKSCTYTATDLHVIELSRNGYNLVLDSSLMNNMGTVYELGEAILQDTGWEISGSLINQYAEEPLAEMRMPSGNTVYVPYSSLKNKPEFFQYFTSTQADEDGVIRGDGAQSYTRITEETHYVTDKRASKYGFFYPATWTFVGLTTLRGERLVYTHKSKFNPALNKVVYYYNGGEVAGYTETEIVAPNLLTNIITNNTFKSADGWTGAYINGPSNSGTDLNAIVKATTSPSLEDEIKNGTFSDATNYVPYLSVELPDSCSCLVNSGFYDNRKVLKNVAAKEKFVLFYKEENGTPFRLSVAAYPYSVSGGQYLSNGIKPFLVFNTDNAKDYSGAYPGYSGYKYIIASVDETYETTEADFLKTSNQFFLTGMSGATYAFYDFQMFRYAVDSSSDSDEPILPSEQVAEAVPVTTYYYYKIADNPEDASAAGYKATAAEYVYCAKQLSPAEEFQPQYTTEAIRSINVKQSNYFNAIQSLCETFECWADFYINHDDSGKVLNKTVVISKYIGQPSYLGFRYGVNLKNSKRTLDSKAIVSKLIVPDNANQYAPNGFCSISRAGASPSGENYIYDFQYYINMGMIDKDSLNEVLYGSKNTVGLYPQLLEINGQLNQIIDQFSQLVGPMAAAQSAVTVAESGKITSEEKYKEAAESFLKLAGYAHTEIRASDLSAEEIEARETQLQKDIALKKYFKEIAEYYLAFTKYSKEFEEATKLYKAYREKSDQYSQEITSLNELKVGLNQAFYNKFYRFIQEGTWKDEEYMDNDKYYIDALNVAHNSSLPKVSYTFNVLDLSQIEGYEQLQYNLADRTWVEDPETFGYKNGQPYREEVVITEVVYALDEPDKDSIKVQNHKNQFADLFQKQTAAVQQVTFAQGVWDKAALFTNSTPQNQASYLQNALGQAELTLQNAGEQSVVWDKDGITVTDINTPSQQIRIVGGAILLRDEDGDGLGWKVGITSKGISAKLLTAGQINTGAVQIMNGDEPYFRWDAYGINAYYFERKNDGFGSYDYGMDTSRGVRFDRMGIYGYRNPMREDGKPLNGAIWHPDNIEEVRKHSQFALTWDGLFLNLGHSYYHNYYYYDKEADKIISTDENGNRLVLNTPIWHAGTATLGKSSPFIFNKRITDKNSPYHGLPYFDPDDHDAKTFAKIFTAGGADGNEELVIYDDGTLVANNIYLTGDVHWTKNASPSRTVYAKISVKEPPPNNTPYSEFPERDGVGTEEEPYVWHQIAEYNDIVYAHTDDGGATWQGPFLITGRSVVGSEIQYAIEEKGLDPAAIPEERWLWDFPTDGFDGKCVYTRSRDVYDNGEVGEWSYSVGYVSSSPITLLISTNTGNMYIDNDINATLTVTAHQDNRDITEEFETNAFLWEKYDADGVKDENWGKRGTSIQITGADIYKKATFNCVLDVERRANKEEK